MYSNDVHGQEGEDFVQKEDFFIFGEKSDDQGE